MVAVSIVNMMGQIIGHLDVGLIMAHDVLASCHLLV